MKLMINDHEITNKMPEGVDLAHALQIIQDEFVGQNEIISYITIDEEPLSSERLSIWKDRPLEDFEETRVEVQSRKDLAANALRLIAERLRESADHRNQIAEHIGRGSGTEALNLMPAYMQVWQAVQQNLASAIRLLEIDAQSWEISPGENILDKIKGLTEQLEQVKMAVESGDLVLMADILDYEFSEQTDIWVKLLNDQAELFEKN